MFIYILPKNSQTYVYIYILINLHPDGQTNTMSESCVKRVVLQVILSDGSAESKIRSPMQAKEGERRSVRG